MASHLGRIEAPVMIGVGAAFDFLAGAKRQAPVWMQRNGLEWLFRLCSEPRRLWRRYAYIVPGFVILTAGELVRHAIRHAGRRDVGLRFKK
jgi:N-acetylglucosaminyldiphosphoundecaprenol N-acetyl-beta-D-mannosaminyltransferase